MGESKIIRRGGGGVVTKTPTISLVSKDEASIIFTITNNDAATADVFWELGDSTPDANVVSLATGVTSSNLTVSGLDDDTEYTIFTFANAENKAGSATASLTVTTDEILPVTLGVEWDQDTDTLTRLEDAVGLTAGANFDNFNPYKLRRCMVNDDLSINYYIDPADPDDIGEVVNTGTYTTGDPANYTGSHGQVMVEIPKFWWKYEEPTSGQYQWYISDVAQTGYDVHPAFITDGVTKDFIYMSAFEGNVSENTLRSISGVQPSTSTNVAGTIVDFRNYAQARGTGWQIQTYWATNALQVLYSVEYANFDSQTTIGQGIVNKASGSGNLSENTGATISLGNTSGAASGIDGLVSISYRGVENFWGNIFTFTDGLNIINREAFVANENFASDVFSGSYTSIGNLATSNGFVSNIQFPHFLATAVSGSSTSHLHDNYFQATGNRIALFGGVWFIGLAAGAFFWNLDVISSSGSRFRGSRLQIL